jgi:hypothetical protein
VNVDPEVGKAALRLSLFIVVLAGGLLLFLAPGTPQFAITVFTLLIGVVFLGVVVLVVRVFS